MLCMCVGKGGGGGGYFYVVVFCNAFFRIQS